jgi:hypothetical protein
MQLQFEIDIETVKKKTRSQKDEELKYLYKERLFHGRLEIMSRTWNVREEDGELSAD